MSEDRFVDVFGDIYEHSPWVARGVWRQHDSHQIASFETMAQAMRAEVENATPDAQMTLIRAHPDLGGKLALAGGLTAESAREQAGAGLAGCTPEQYERLQSLNAAYTDKFGFPFIVAVKGMNRDDILQAMATRLNNEPSIEERRALDEIHKIARFRLEGMF